MHCIKEVYMIRALLFYTFMEQVALLETSVLWNFFFKIIRIASFFFENLKRKRPVPSPSINVCGPPQYKYTVTVEKKRGDAEKYFLNILKQTKRWQKQGKQSLKMV